MKYWPSWRYHVTEAPRLVLNAEEEALLGPGWADWRIDLAPEDMRESASIPKKRGRPKKGA